MACSSAPPKDRRPVLDAAELRRDAKRAKAELQRACEVPIPDAADVDEDLAPQGSMDDGAAAGTSKAQEPAAAGEAPDRPQAEAAKAPVGHAEEAVVGEWISDKGECFIGEDRITSRLAFEEPLGDGSRVHGWLVKQEPGTTADDGSLACWQATLTLLDEGQGPWYGPSFGQEPEALGDIQVRLLVSGGLQTRIRVADEDTDWQPPVTFRRRPPGSAEAAAVVAELAARGDTFVFGAGA